MIAFIAGVLIANHAVRRIEDAINPPRSWVAVEMERRVPPDVEVDDAVAAVYTLVMAPVFIVVAMILGAFGLVTMGVFGAMASLVIAGFVGHVAAMSVTARCVDASVRRLREERDQ